jgi:hypothetical protein
MKKRWILLTQAVLVIALVLAIGIATAQEKTDTDKAIKKDADTEKAVEKMSGKDLFKNYCKTCHGPESPHGEYTPMHLIQEQWERFFDEKYEETHGAVVDSLHGGQPVLKVINKKMLKKIRKFSVDGAADSEHPMTCG